MKTLTPSERRALRARAHALHPVVSISGKGLSEAVTKEIDNSLKAHELIKVRVYGAERDEREALLETIARTLDAAPVQHIGNILVFYRERPQDAPAPPPAPAVRRKPAAKPNPRRRVAARPPPRRPR